MNRMMTLFVLVAIAVVAIGPAGLLAADTAVTQTHVGDRVDVPAAVDTLAASTPAEPLRHRLLKLLGVVGCVGLGLMAMNHLLYGDDRRLPGPLDANLQLADADTITETGDLGSAVDLGENFAPDPVLPLRLGLNVTALDTDDTDEVYWLVVLESADDVTYVETGLRVRLLSTGTYHLVVGVTKRYVKLRPELSGTTPSVTASAWLCPT